MFRQRDTASRGLAQGGEGGGSPAAAASRPSPEVVARGRRKEKGAREEGARQGSRSGLEGPRETADSRQKERRDKSLQNEDKESGSDQINRQQRGVVKRERDRKIEERNREREKRKV